MHASGVVRAVHALSVTNAAGAAVETDLENHLSAGSRPACMERRQNGNPRAMHGSDHHPDRQALGLRDQVIPAPIRRPLVTCSAWQPPRSLCVPSPPFDDDLFVSNKRLGFRRIVACQLVAEPHVVAGRRELVV